jgi:hypothetical protein
VLERAGLISRRVEGRTHHLSLVPAPLRTASEWLAFYEAFWEGGIDRLSDLARSIEGEQAPSKRGDSR